MSEKLLQIIGADVVGKDIVKLTLIPYTSKEVRKKKHSMIELAMKGIDTQEVVEQLTNEQKLKSVLFVSRDEWLNFFKNKLYSVIKIEYDMFKEMPDRK